MATSQFAVSLLDDGTMDTVIEITCNRCSHTWEERYNLEPHDTLEEGEEWDRVGEALAMATEDAEAEGCPEFGDAPLTRLEQLKSDNGGTLPAVAWPGGYPIVYYASDCETVCPPCANSGDFSLFPCHGFFLVAHDVYWEGPPLQCCHCGAEIESAYGDPDADDE